jgi:succinate dehydrogenase / fumarate reductase cytochrome b subunit
MSRSFLLTRLHSLMGILPLGIFLIEHFYSNAVAMLGEQAYNEQVERLLGIPFLFFIEIVFIFIPLVYHAVFGLYLAFISKHNALSYKFTRNWMFMLQRLSGVVTLIFVTYHLWAFRISSVIYGTPINYDTVQAHLANPFILVFYIIGVIATTFHFTNGLWGAAITWGFSVSPRSQAITGKIAYSFFFVLSVVGVATLFSF